MMPPARPPTRRDSNYVEPCARRPFRRLLSCVLFVPVVNEADYDKDTKDTKGHITGLNSCNFSYGVLWLNSCEIQLRQLMCRDSYCFRMASTSSGRFVRRFHH